MTPFTQADIDAAEKRGRTIGVRTATSDYRSLLAMQIQVAREVAWDEGVKVALNFAKRNPDGVTLRLEKTNPYRPTAKEES